MNGGSRASEMRGHNPVSLRGFVKSRPGTLAIADRSGRESSNFALTWEPATVSIAVDPGLPWLFCYAAAINRPNRKTSNAQKDSGRIGSGGIDEDIQGGYSI